MSTRQSLVFSFLDRYASLAIAVASSMIIARLLTPTEIGVYSVTMVLLMFVTTVRDMGAGTYLLQEKELTTERIRAVWTVQLGLGIGIAFLVLLVSYPVALLYNEPRMSDILLVVALNYAINPFGSLTYAWLMREMRFEKVALMRFSAALCGALVSTVLAWHNFGPISLAFGSLAATVANALIAVFYRPQSFPWLPGVKEIRRVLAFGSKVTGSSIVNVISGSATELLLSKLQSLTAVGLYSRANGLVQMFRSLFVDAVGSVCLPWFARHSRDHGSMVEPFLKAVSYVTACGWTFCVLIVCLAHPIVRVLYGNQWDHAIDLTRLLAVAMMFSVPAALCQVALLSSGAPGTIARVTIVCAFQNIAFVAIGASQGLMALGFAVIASSAVSATLWLRATSRHIDLSLGELLLTLRHNAFVVLPTAIGPVLALWIYGPFPKVYLQPLILGVGGGVAGFMLGIIIFKHPLREEIRMIWLKIKESLIKF